MFVFLTGILFCICSGLESKALVEPYLYDMTDTGVQFRAVGSGAKDLLKVKVKGNREYICENPVEIAPKKYLYSVEFVGLSPSTAYTYSFSFGKQELSGLSFKTAPKTFEPKEIKFVVWGDTQTLVMNTKAADSIAALKPDFLLHVGDLVRGDGRIWKEWPDYFFNPARALLGSAPVFPVPGNHEQGVELFSQLFPAPKSSSKHAANGYYSFDYGNAHFVSVHVWYGAPGAREKSPVLYNANKNGRDDVSELKAMLAEDAASPVTKAQMWKFLYIHIPPDVKDGPESMRKTWLEILPLLKTYGFDMAFFGHKHIFADTRELIVDGEDSGMKGMTVGLYWSEKEDWDLKTAPTDVVCVPSFALVTLNKNGKKESVVQPYVWDRVQVEFTPSVKETVLTR